MNALFVTGTDTGAGKTIVTGLLARYMLEKGYNAVTQKWVSTGDGKHSADVGIHLKLMRKKRQDVKALILHISPYVFKRAASPHLASALEKRRIGIDKIVESFRHLSKEFDFVIVEGAGGALVPVNKKTLIMDIAQRLRLPVLIVANNKLGAINHTLLTIEAIKRRNMRIIGVLFNARHRKTDRIVLKDNPRIIRALSGENMLGSLPYSKDMDYLYRKFAPAGRKILEWITG